MCLKHYFNCFLANNSEKGEDKNSKRRCVCHAGAGIEVTPGEGNTEGFPLWSEVGSSYNL
jgi:hypothetical protein